MTIILQQVAQIDEVPVYAYTYPSGQALWVINPADISDKEKQEAFMKWMRGQTMPVIPDGPPMVYSQDYSVFNTSWNHGDKNPHVFD